MTMRENVLAAIEVDLILAELRATGAWLKAQFGQAGIELDDMFAAFRRVDGAAATALRRRLAALYPAIGWLDIELDEPEEGLGRAARGDFWICDAIDGAVQYVRAIPNWCTSLTLLRDGEAVFMAVYDAMHEEMFHAQAGGAAFLNGVPIRVNGRNSHHNGVLATSQPPFAAKYPLALDYAGKSLTAVLAGVVAVRNLGPTSLQLAYVACGRLDAFWEYGPDGCNCMGAALLVARAGGLVSEAGGARYTLGSASIVAASAGAHASLSLRLDEAVSA